MKLRPLSASRKLQARADQVIAGGALTNSKRPQSFVRGVYPTHIQRGIDAVVFDADGNKYVDYICGLGSQLFGYRNDRINAAVMNQLTARGSIFSLGTELEVEVAEGYANLFSHIEQVRFLKTGSEACSAAIRIARAATGRTLVLSDHYHGWSDEFTSLTPPASGVPPQNHIKKLWRNQNDIASGEAAAVILEPVAIDCSEDNVKYLRSLRASTAASGTLLIFDETITGLRYPGLSVSKRYGIDPDLTIMGKAIGGGLPLALVGGRAQYMSADYFVSSTFAGDCLALAAAKAVLDILKDQTVLIRLESQAKAFQTLFNRIQPDLALLEGYGTRCAFKFPSDMTKALFFQECVKAGVLFGPSFFYGTTHHEHDEFTLGVCKSVLTRISNNEVKLEGELPVTPFAQKVREQ